MPDRDGDRNAPRRGVLSRTLANLTLTLASLAVLALLLELVVFRFVLIPSDVPGNVFVDGLVRLEPGDRGVWRVRDEIAARFEVNRQGWNSGVGDYRRARTPGTLRVAVIGDSYVEALQVDADRSLAEQLARELAGAGVAAECFRFGISAAPLSQYLHMLERAAIAYRPDVVVVVLVHNDFRESYRGTGGRYASSFLKLRVRDGAVRGEIPPAPYRRTWRDALRQTATLRYLYYRRQVTPASVIAGARALLDSASARLSGEAADRRERPQRHQANVDTRAVIRDLPAIEAATDHLFGRLDEAAGVADARLLLVMDGHRQHIYRGADPASSKALALNRLAARVAATHGIPFLDLHPVFAADWREHGRRLEHVHDAHWNARGHALAARAVARRLLATR